MATLPLSSCASFALSTLLVVIATCAPAAAQPRDPFTPDVRTYEWAGIYLLESWNKNLSTDHLVGATFTAGASWTPDWQALTEFALQRGALSNAPDPLYVSVTGGVRRRLVRRGAATLYVDGLFGISVATRHLPRGGSSFNWIAQGGGGALWSLGSRSYLATGARVFHLSNGGIFGDGRNPDLELIGGYVGVGVSF